MIDDRRISQSEMKTFLRCRRKWWLSDFRRLAPIGSDPTGPLRSGSRVHTALEAYYTPDSTVTPREALEGAIAEDWAAYVAAIAAEDREPDIGTVSTFAKETDTERAMIEGYMQWLEESGADAGLTVTDVETVVSVDGAEVAPNLVAAFRPFRIVGKLDARVTRDFDGARFFMDHKTTQSLTQPLAGLQSDPQMLHYHWLELMTLDDHRDRSDGAIYNMLRKVKRSKASKPPYFAREYIYHNAEEIAAYAERLLHIIREILRLEEMLTYPERYGTPAQLAYPTRTRDCDWDCPFSNVCPMFDDGSRAEAMLTDQFRERDPLARYSSDTDKSV